MSARLTQVHPAGSDAGDAPYAPGIVAGDLVFVSGQVALDDEGRVVAPGDLSGQVECVFQRIRGVLAAAGAGLDDVANCTVFLTRAEDFAEFNRCWTREFGGHRPTRVTVVAELVMAGLLVEIQAIAVRTNHSAATAADRRNIDVA